MQLWSILRKPSRLDKLAESDERFKKNWWKNTRVQVKILHCFCVSYFLFVCTSVNYYGVTLGLPTVHGENGKSLLLAQVLLTYLCVSGILNYFFVIHFAKKSHFGFSQSKLLPFTELNSMRDFDSLSDEVNSGGNAGSSSDWRKCSHCSINVPPRARHCSICQCCVLKKDHHCFFTACCIGFYNQQFFIRCAFFGVIGGFYGFLSIMTYLHYNYAPFLSLQIYTYFLPYCVLSCMLGVITLHQMFMVILAYLNIMSVLTALYFISYQVYIIIYGQTSYELVKRMKKNMYGNNLVSNIRSVFGPYWFVGFLIPLPVLRNEGNGINWIVSSKMK